MTVKAWKVIGRCLLVLLCVVLVIAIVGIAQFFHRSDPKNVKRYDTDNPFITGETAISAHRSGAGDYPEETLAAFRGCVENPDFAVDYFEFDLHMTADDILVLSHDEVVHLKCSMINKMPGDLKEKFQNLMVGYAFMFGHPGKKLLFMGQDFGQLREWSEEREIDWFLLADEGHQHLQTFFSDLLKMYRKYPALYANDCGYEGFQWINANDGDRSIYSFVRWSPTGKNNLLFVCNFTPVERPDYMCGVPRKKQYRLILDSSDMKYGGPTEKRQMVYRAKNGECDGQPYRIAYSLPAYGVAVFSF